MNTDLVFFTTIGKKKVKITTNASKLFSLQQVSENKQKLCVGKDLLCFRQNKNKKCLFAKTNRTLLH